LLLGALIKGNENTISAESQGIFATQVRKQEDYSKKHGAIHRSSHIAAANAWLTNTFTKIISITEGMALLPYTPNYPYELTLSPNVRVRH